ncbi:hypothetical protein N7455_009306 [Penicillium solitum]|uniref:uncharacterized protein n=1 Tax=Penicillium solitum TaxID=60172 RepID=UPI00180A3AC8|nr:hypothetical protein HAV15_012097 [Penicillium sp. str. \
MFESQLYKVTSCCRYTFSTAADVGFSPPYDARPDATELYISSNTRVDLPIVQFDIIIQRQPAPYHQSYFSPSTPDAQPVSPLVNIPPLSQTNTPPNLQVPSPPVCSTGS